MESFGRESQTIAAISTGLIPSGVGMVRVSGPKAIEIADQVFQTVGQKPLQQRKGYTSAFGHIHDGDEMIDEGVAAVYRAPHSYTGEDVVELCCHGGVYLMERTLRVLLDHGARLAEEGEFTKRAFLNGKLSLDQAESVIGLIQAESAGAARAALAGKDGALKREILSVQKRLTGTAAHLSAWVDYPEEDVEELSPQSLVSEMEGSQKILESLYKKYDTGKMIRKGISTAIVGKPNVGKSTLMNLLSRYERSIVTDIPGTTRDVVEESVLIGGYALRLADTAGLRETEDQVEAIGVQWSRKKMESSDLILAVFDLSRPMDDDDHALLETVEGRTFIAILNKKDAASEADISAGERLIREKASDVLVMSAQTGEGLEQLEQMIPKVLGLNKIDPAAAMIANERQRECVKRALDALAEGIEALRAGITLDAVSVCLEDALSPLMELTGERASDAVIEQVFEQFCVGK